MRRSTGPRSLAPCALLVALGAVAAQARAGALTVDTAACPSVDAAEVERRVQLELAEVARAQEGAPALRVTFACDEPTAGRREVSVIIADPVTDKRVERRVPMPPPADRERVLALVTAQLFVTSWLELLTHPAPEARPEPRTPPSPQLVAHARDTAAAKTDLASRTEPRAALDVGALLDVRSLLASPLRLAGAFVRPSLRLGDQTRIELAGAFAVGQASRARGVVDATLASLGAGVGWRSSAHAAFAFDVHALVALAYARALGNATTDAASDASAHGFFVDLALAAGPSLRLGATSLSLELAGGLAAPRLRATVAGEPDVTLSGPWLGVHLSLGAGWGGR